MRPFDIYRVNSVLRLKRSEYLQHGHDCQKVADWLTPLRCGQCRFLRNCPQWSGVSQSIPFRVNVALLWEKGYEEPWVIIEYPYHLPRDNRCLSEAVGN